MFGLARLGYNAIKIVLKPLWDVTFGPIVKRSHALHLAWREQVRWETLTRGLSYYLRTSSALSNDPNPVSTLLVRNDGDTVVDRLEVCVEAGIGKLIYPDVTVIPFLEPGKIARMVVKNMPVENMWVKNGTIRTSYEYVKVFPVSLVRGGKSEEVSRHVLQYHPTHTDFLNGHLLRRWGCLYNTDAIEEYKQDTRDFLRWVLCDQFGVYLWMPIYADNRLSVVEHLRRLPNVFLFRLVSNRIVLPIICWTALLLRLHVLGAAKQEENEPQRKPSRGSVAQVT